MIMILDVYDIIKKVNKHLKIKSKLSAISNGPIPGDIADRTYQIINHKKGEAKEFKYTLNTAL